MKSRTLVVEGERITAVVDGYRVPAAGDVLIDLSGYTVLPGLMDMHTHLTSEYSRRSDLERFTLDAADVAPRASAYAERTLRAGFTTVRDLGDRFDASIALREAINSSVEPEPRIYTAGKSIATNGGHADPTNGWADQLQPERGPKDGVVNGPDEAAAAVRQRCKDGTDLIEVTATGGVLSVARNGRNPAFSEEDCAAAALRAGDWR